MLLLRVRSIAYDTPSEGEGDLMIPFAKLYDANFIVPENAEFATAIGSCLANKPEND